VIAFGLIHARFCGKNCRVLWRNSAGARDSREIHHFETMPGAVWKPAIHHPRRMACQSCRNRSEGLRSHAFDLVLASSLLPVIISTIEFKIALETDVCSCPQGFDIVKELAAIGCECDTADKPGGSHGLSVHLISL
jgi:hypothetical protein